VKQRAELVSRLMVAQGELRRQFEVAAPKGLQDEFAEFGGITLHQMVVLRRLVLFGERMTMGDVAAAQGIGASGATQLVDRLERRGLLARTRDEHDRRVQLVVPTDRAKALARRVKSGVSQAAEHVLGVLDDDELQVFVELTERVAQVSQVDADRPRRRAAV
jgi:DNA-binding MarR family transcriptional regulator